MTVNQEGLEEEFRAYCYDFKNPETGEELVENECSMDMEQARMLARHFAQWGAERQKKQMLKEAVEGIAVINANAKTDGFGYVRSDYLPDDFLRGLGNFRLVIVKEDAE